MTVEVEIKSTSSQVGSVLYAHQVSTPNNLPLSAVLPLQLLMCPVAENWSSLIC